MAQPKILTREQLYELVWTTPKHQLPTQLGISDVAIAKRCRKLDIPIPPRGYWARVQSGQTPKRPPLPKREDENHDLHALTFFEGTNRQSAEAPDDAWTLRLAQIQPTPFTSITEAHPILRRTALALKYARVTDLALSPRDRTGAIVDIEVSPAQLERALMLGDSLIRMAEALGWKFEVPPPTPPDTSRYGRYGNPPEPPPPTHPIGHFLIHGEIVRFRIEERMRDVPRTPTAAELAREKREYRYHAPRHDLIPTGVLRIARIGRVEWGEPERRSWYDRKACQVETQIPEILHAFQELAERLRIRRLKDEQEAREREAEERRMEALKQRRAANAERIEQLETLAGAWVRATLLRRFHRALLRAHPDKVAEYAWIAHYTNQMDPLTPTSRDPDWEPPISESYYREDHSLNESLLRLCGHQWHTVEKASKSGPGAPPVKEA